jgi:hypothetical protein
MARSAVFRVPLSRPSDVAVQVDYETVDDSATEPSDYTSVSGTIIFAPGETVKQIIVPVRDDIPGSSLEQFKLVLSNPVACSIRRDTGICELSEVAIDSEPSVVVENIVVPSS